MTHILELQALQNGDEVSFQRLARDAHPAMVRVAYAQLGDHGLAEEAAQEAWLLALEKLPTFEGRSSLKTWLCGIANNVARSKARKEARLVPAPSIAVGEPDGHAHHPGRFERAVARMKGHWNDPPDAWSGRAKNPAICDELRRVMRQAYEALPTPYQQVFALRDIDGLSSEETAEILGVQPGHQRVLLHRARSRLRASLEAYWQSGEDTGC